MAIDVKGLNELILSYKGKMAIIYLHFSREELTKRLLARGAGIQGIERRFKEDEINCKFELEPKNQNELIITKGNEEEVLDQAVKFIDNLN
jgi:hypothetical protein